MEPYPRAERPSDPRPVVFTERQVMRMVGILNAVLDRGGPSETDAFEQLEALHHFLLTVGVESQDRADLAVTSAESWARLDALPYFLPLSHNVRHLDALRRRGLDPSEQPPSHSPDDSVN